MDKNLLLRSAAVAAYVVMVAVNYLATSLPIGGRDTGEISDNYPNLFAPAGYAFSIWGLIYLMLGAFVVYQFYHKDDQLAQRISGIFILNAILNVSWIFAWHYDVIWLSVIIMIGLLLTLIRMADIIISRRLSDMQKWLIRLPFSVYFGWITVATIANITVFLVSIGWKGFGIPESYWTVMALLLGAMIGSWRAFRDRNIPYGLVLVWAYAAIAYKHISSAGFDGKYPSVIWIAALCILSFTALMASIALNDTKGAGFGGQKKGDTANAS